MRNMEIGVNWGMVKIYSLYRRCNEQEFSRFQRDEYAIVSPSQKTRSVVPFWDQPLQQPMQSLWEALALDLLRRATAAENSELRSAENVEEMLEIEANGFRSCQL